MKSSFLEKLLKSKVVRLSIKYMNKYNIKLTLSNLIDTMKLIRNRCIELDISYDEFENRYL